MSQLMQSTKNTPFYLYRLLFSKCNISLNSQDKPVKWVFVEVEDKVSLIISWRKEAVGKQVSLSLSQGHQLENDVKNNGWLNGLPQISWLNYMALQLLRLQLCKIFPPFNYFILINYAKSILSCTQKYCWNKARRVIGNI